MMRLFNLIWISVVVFFAGLSIGHLLGYDKGYKSGYNDCKNEPFKIELYPFGRK